MLPYSEFVVSRSSAHCEEVNDFCVKMSSALEKASQIIYQLSSVLIPLSIIYVSPPGINLFSWHPVLMSIAAAAIACLLGGFGAIYLAKSNHSKPHFTSWHGTMGLATVLGALGASCGGIATKYGVKFPPLVRPAHIKWVHSVAGTAVFSLGCFALLLGLSSTWALDNMNRLERCSAGTLTVFLLITVAYLAKRNYLFKLFQLGKK